MKHKTHRQWRTFNDLCRSFFLKFNKVEKIKDSGEPTDNKICLAVLFIFTDLFPISTTIYPLSIYSMRKL